MLGIGKGSIGRGSMAKPSIIAFKGLGGRVSKELDIEEAKTGHE